MRLFIICAFASFCASCEKDDSPETVANTVIIPVKIPDNPSSSEGIRFLALGDSYTIGQSVPEKERWPAHLVDTLESQGYQIDSLKYIATTGWTTQNLISAMNNEAELDSFNLVSLLIGVNNFYQGQDTNRYIQEFELLLLRSIQIAGSKERTFVVSIPDYGATPFGRFNEVGIGKTTDTWNSINRRITEQYEVDYYDITGISREGKNNYALYTASDSLHPSGYQYNLWAEKIYEGLSGKLKP